MLRLELHTGFSSLSLPPLYILFVLNGAPGSSLWVSHKLSSFQSSILAHTTILSFIFHFEKDRDRETLSTTASFKEPPPALPGYCVRVLHLPLSISLFGPAEKRKNNGKKMTIRSSGLSSDTKAQQ